MNYFTAYLQISPKSSFIAGASNPAFPEISSTNYSPANTLKVGYQEIALRLPNRRQNHPTFFPLVLSHQTGKSHVAAYYTLAHQTLGREELPDPSRLPRYPVPVILLA